MEPDFLTDIDGICNATDGNCAAFARNLHIAPELWLTNPADRRYKDDPSPIVGHNTETGTSCARDEVVDEKVENDAQLGVNDEGEEEKDSTKQGKLKGRENTSSQRTAREEIEPAAPEPQVRPTRVGRRRGIRGGRGGSAANPVRAARKVRRTRHRNKKDGDQAPFHSPISCVFLYLNVEVYIYVESQHRLRNIWSIFVEYKHWRFRIKLTLI